MSFGARSRAALASLGTLGLALVAGVSPASAADGKPTTPTQLFNGYRTCSTDAHRPTYLSAVGNLVVEGIPGTADTTGSPSVSIRYQVFPVGDPTRTATVTRDHTAAGNEAPGILPADALTDGQTYAWQAQTVVGDAASDWTSPCFITIDSSRPANAPTVSSPNYPPTGWNQGGEPVTFKLSPNGVDDVTGYEYSWQQDLPVIGTSIGDHGIPQPVDPYADTKYFTRADATDGSATISLVPPTGVGPMTLWVRSLDRAYNSSATSSYGFYVSSTAPTLTPAVPSPEFGVPTTFTLRPDPALQAKSPVVGYSVHTSGGSTPDRTVEVAAAADGTADVQLTLDGVYGEFVQVTSRSANGWVSDAASWSSSYDTTPTVASDVYPEYGSSGGVGVPGTFTFTSKVKDVVSFTYSFNGGPEATVAAGADGTASVDWTPDSDGGTDLMVSATTGSGIQLAPYDYFFTVN
ncbi:hypothetical protein [Streptomyces griseofuscus]|uniref:Uncharacterized protein n=1 Tax=Streptomyces griseofuscus TaxID=146922 RepID=A0A426SAP1_9ACTN|nr:hypothetical protein [Streptomyces griseofuscus]RRQ87411.1 hypothetical protein CQW44_10785 [Streptomyces griseofuscus]